MQVTEVRIKLMEQSEDRLRAFCSITIDHAFVVRDLKIIDGTTGPFVAMPSRKLSGHCARCGYKNHLRAAYCNQCGIKLRVAFAADTPQKLYADVAHPINSECREMISNAVLAEFDAELKRAAEPDYRSRYDDEFDAIAESDDDSFTRIDAAPSQPAFVSETDEIQSVEKAIPAPHVDNKPSRRPTNVDDSSASDDAFGAGIF